MSKYQAPDNWNGGITPDGKTTDFNVYMMSWNALITTLEHVTGLEVTGYGGNDISLQKVEDGKILNTVTIPLWFAQILTDKI